MIFPGEERENETETLFEEKIAKIFFNLEKKNGRPDPGSW